MINDIEETLKKQRARSYNIIVIRRLWKLVKKDYGEPIVNGEYDVNNIYRVLNMSKEKMRLVRSGEYIYDFQKVLRHAIKVNNRSGIPVAYLTGDEVINIPGMRYDEDEWSETNESISRIEDVRIEINRNLKNKSQTEIEEMATRAKRLSAEHKQRLKDEINEHSIHIKEKKQFIDNLDNALKQLLEKDITKIKDKNLYQLVYFVCNGKKFDEYSATTIDDIIKIMKQTGFDKLQSLSDDSLKEYKEQLARQVKLVDAIKVIREDKRQFKNI